MDVLTAAKMLGDAVTESLSVIGRVPCQFCRMNAHADDCPLLMMPKIAAAIDAAKAVTDAEGDEARQAALAQLANALTAEGWG